CCVCLFWVWIVQSCCRFSFVFFFFFKQKTAYEITTGDWSSDVCSSDLVRRQPRVGVRRARRRRDRREARAPRPLAPLHPIPRHPHVIRRRRPVQIDLAPAHRRRRQIARRRRRLRVRRRRPHPRIHVRLDLGRRQRPVVDPYLVDPSREVLPRVAVRPDLQRPRRRRQRRRLRLAHHLYPVHVQPHRRPVERPRQVRPRVQPQPCRPNHDPCPRRPRPSHRRPVALVRRRHQVVPVHVLVDHRPPPRQRPRRVHPRLQRHPRRQPQRR